MNSDDRGKGKAGAYIFALLMSTLLGYFCWSSERRGEEVEPWVWVPLSVLIGTSLGVQIDPEAIGRFLGK